MDTVDAPTFTPRLRMSRHSPVHYDRSSNLASTSEAGPSRLPNLSQILDLDMKDIPLSDDQFSSNELNTPKITIAHATTRSDNPAAALRALMLRLPAHPPSPGQSHALSAQDVTERESDFDTISESNIAPGIAQENLKHIFSKALRDPGNTPQKARRRRNSIDASEVDASPRVEKERATNKGKRRSMSDDEIENISQSIDRRDIRVKSTSQPVTMEFLRERFSNSHNLRTSIKPQRSAPNHDSSNDTATILRDLNSSQATPPAATSTPQQSLRLSTSSRFQFHSNLLDQDSEMQKVIDGLNSYDESISHGQTSASRAFNSPKTVLRHQSSRPSVKPKSRSERHARSEVNPTSSRLSPLPRTELYQHHSPSSRTTSPAESFRSHGHDDVDVVYERQRNWNSHPIWHKPSPSPILPKALSPSSEQSSPTPSRTSSLQAVDNTYRTNDLTLRHTLRSSPPLSSSKERSGVVATSVKTPVSSRRDETSSSFVDRKEETEANMSTATPIQSNNSHEKPLSRRNSTLQLIKTTEPTASRNEDTGRDRDVESDGLRETDFSSPGEMDKLGVATSSPDISEGGHSRPGTPLGNGDPPREHGISNTPDHTAQMDTTMFPLTPTRNKASRSLRNESKTPSPPKGLPDLPTPSSSDESDRGSSRSDAANRPKRNGQSGLKWMATPKPPGGWLNTPKEVMAQSNSIDIIQSDDDTPPATDEGLSYSKTPSRTKATYCFQSFSKTPRPPGGWVSTPAPPPMLAQSMPDDSPLNMPQRNRGLLTPVASLSRGSKLEPKTPAVPGAWLATPAVKKSILKVRFEPEVSTLTDNSLASAKHREPPFGTSTSAANSLDVKDYQQTEQLSPKSPPSPRRQKSSKSHKIRVLDAFGREHEPNVSNNQACVDSSASPLRVIDAMGHEIDEGSHMEDTEAAATLTCSASSRGELVSRIRNGLDDLVAGIDDFEKDNRELTLDQDRLQQLTTISKQARGLREKLYSRTDSSHSLLSSTLNKKTLWFPAKPKFYIFLIILQLSLIWLMYRISINRAQELFLNTYYDPFNPELHLYIFKSDASLHVLRSEGARPSWSPLIGHIWDRWIYFIGSMQFHFWDKGTILEYDNPWTPT